MQTVLVIILVGVLGISFVAFCVLGLKQWKRSQTLAQIAYKNKLHFSSTDIFNIPLRYNFFSLMQTGHSLRAYNITYGNVNGMAMRGFDFNYEVAHGPRREVRLYSLVVIETPCPVKKTILWNKSDIDNAPIEIHKSELSLEKWTCIGDTQSCELFTRLMSELEFLHISIETFDRAILLAVPCENRKSSYFDIYPKIPQFIEAVKNI